MILSYETRLRPELQCFATIFFSDYHRTSASIQEWQGNMLICMVFLFVRLAQPSHSRLRGNDV
ncbi:MAG: hypothetical protein KKE82_02550, partial [Proteobacteria bacterium]|nr:hypothetical protein [Pseudomonadota bacterium]